MFGGKNAFRIGAIVLIVLAVGSWAAFTRYNPFANPYRVQAAFKGPQDVRVNSAVRLAGVDIGKVTAVEEGPEEGTSIIEMEIEEKGRPLGKDASFKVRPRLFLEGNYFIDVSPGTPRGGGAGGGRRRARHPDGRAGVGGRPAEDLREQHARERAHAARRVRPRGREGRRGRVQSHHALLAAGLRELGEGERGAPRPAQGRPLRVPPQLRPRGVGPQPQRAPAARPGDQPR